MATISKNIRNAVQRIFTRRSTSPAKELPEQKDVNENPQVFDAITMESIVSVRGQNPFPEEEGEMSFMTSTMREQSLHSR